MNILTVEDDPRTADAIRHGLEEAGWNADLLTRGDEAVQRISTQAYDAVIMDIMLPGCDGLSAVRQLRNMSNSTPVLLLSARGDVDQRISGLNAGADDYLPKPFSMAEVIARVRAITRRGGEAGAILLRLADLTLNVPQRTAQRAGRSIELSPREFRLLEVLLQNVGNVCTRTELLRQVWDYAFDPGTNLVDVYIRKLREKVDYGYDLPLLHTVRGVGYQLSDKTP
ncbi:response regulator transcription factor [Phragmitibacter flavus]|uniref:Response regulator transcription factor n=1 Tax=Phragmitibacter flavus TaxID=2576071 RepID=A0A5R8KE26_9BACT|nr:response regulator transcription factor [Phragmitibacter flavus]TLD70507.1 response regulator transcription factor [Phragmitibacter flavus]